MKIGTPVPILTEDQMRDWTRRNMECFDQLPDDVRYALRETGVNADCGKLQQALALGVPVEAVVAEIEARANAQASAMNRADRRQMKAMTRH